MKKIAISIVFLIIFLACSNAEPIFELKILPVKDAKTPAFFEHGTIDTISIKYELPNRCHSFKGVYYKYDNTARIVAIYTLFDVESTCPESIIEQEIDIPIHVLQQENYIFKFYKGKNSNGENVFEEIEVPVN